MRKRRATAEDAAIGRTLRALRLDRGLSQSDLGRAAGVTFQQLQKYEKGTNRVSAARLARIADALNVPVTAFYGAAASAPKHASWASPICRRAARCGSRAPMRACRSAGQGRRWSRLRSGLRARTRTKVDRPPETRPSSVAVWKRMDEDQCVMKSHGDLVGRKRLLCPSNSECCSGLRRAEYGSGCGQRQYSCWWCGRCLPSARRRQTCGDASGARIPRQRDCAFGRRPRCLPPGCSVAPTRLALGEGQHAKGSGLRVLPP